MDQAVTKNVKIIDLDENNTNKLGVWLYSVEQKN